MQVVGLYRTATLGGLGIAGFAAPGHWVWEIHVMDGSGLQGVIFIEAESKQTFVFPPDSTH